MNEWGFAGEVKSRWDRDLTRNPGWDADRWEVESQEEGSLKRSDLALKAAGRTLVVGELRLPDHPQSSPWDPENLNNAISRR